MASLRNTTNSSLRHHDATSARGSAAPSDREVNNDVTMAFGAPVYSDDDYDDDTAYSHDDGDDDFGFDPNFTSSLAPTTKERDAMVPSAGEYCEEEGAAGGRGGEGEGIGAL